MKKTVQITLLTILLFIFNYSLDGSDNTIRITNKTSGNKLQFFAGSFTRISWKENKVPARFSLLLVQNDHICGIIAEDIIAENGYFNWKTGMLSGFSLEKGNKFKISIKGTELGSEEFSITPGSYIELEDINSEVPSGTILPVKWNCSLVSGTLKISLKNRSGNLYSISTDTPVDKGYYLWNTSRVKYRDLRPGKYKLVITNETDNLKSESDYFTITESQSISITSPVFGTNYYAGDKIPITWTSQNAQPVRIELLKNSKLIKILGKQLGTGKQYFLWDSGKTESGTGYSIRMRSADGQISGSADFNIFPERTISILPLPPSTSPGQEVKIIWRTTGLNGSINLELLKKGKHVGWIARKIDVKDELYFWRTGTIMEKDPVEEGEQFTIRASSNESGTQDETLPFDINKGYYLNISDPALTTTWTNAFSRTIRWQTNADFPVKISLISDKGRKIVLKNNFNASEGKLVISRKTMLGKKLSGNFRISVESKEHNFVTLSRNKVLIMPSKLFNKKLTTNRISYNRCWQDLAQLLKKQAIKKKRSKKSLKKKTGRKNRSVTAEAISDLLTKHSRRTDNPGYADYLSALSRDIRQNCLNCITGTTFNIPPGYPEILIRKSKRNIYSMTVFRRHPGSNIRYNNFISSFTDIQNTLPFEKSSSVPFSKEVFPVYTGDVIYSSTPVKETAVVISSNRSGDDSGTPEVIIFRNIAEQLFNSAIKPLAYRCFHSRLSNMVTLQSYIDLIALKRINHFAGPLPIFYDEEEKNLFSISKRAGEVLFALERIKSGLSSYMALPVLIKNGALEQSELYGIRVTWLAAMIRSLRNEKQLTYPLTNTDIILLMDMEQKKILEVDKSASVINIKFSKLDSYVQNTLSSVFRVLSSKQPSNPVSVSPIPEKLKKFVNTITSIPGYTVFRFTLPR